MLGVYAMKDEKRRPKDWILDLWVTLAENQEDPDAEGIDITLSVGGMLMSGRLISVRKFFEMHDKGTMKRHISKLINEEFDGSRDESDERVYEFIHLRDVRYAGIGGSVLACGPDSVWRGRIDRVDGFQIGTIVSQA